MVAAGEGAIWLVTTGDRPLSRLDPETNEVVASVGPWPGVGESPNAIVAGEGAVWTVHPSGLLKYDPVTNAFASLPDNVELSSDFNDIAEDGSFGTDIAAGNGAIWVSVGDILQLDPETGELRDRIRPPSDADSTVPGWLAVGEGRVWHASPLGRVTVIESATNTVTNTADVSDALDDISVGEGAVWAMNATTDDSVLRIDPVTGQAMGSPVRVGRTPTAVAAGAGAVWVTSGRDHTVTRIDPATLDLKTIELGGAATSVAVGLGGVWVTVNVR
jgi:streptogramin lyase